MPSLQPLRHTTSFRSGGKDLRSYWAPFLCPPTKCRANILGEGSSAFTGSFF